MSTPASHAAMAARFAEYTRLRDGGAAPEAARAATGLAYSADDSAARKYERAYRRMRNLPARPGFRFFSPGQPS